MNVILEIELTADNDDGDNDVNITECMVLLKVACIMSQIANTYYIYSHVLCFYHNSS